MKLNFESNLEHQIKAIQSVVSLLDGQSKEKQESTFHFQVKGNSINLTDQEIQNNLKRVIAENELNADICKLDSGIDYCIEAETGTGKTYIYLRTIIELYSVYGLNKFLIIVPSIAVKEGVLKTLESTKKHFRDLYSMNYDYYEYSSKKLNRIKQFVDSPTLQIMIMTLQSFNHEDRIMNQSSRDDNIDGLSYMGAIAQTKPIIIMDEPQEGMDSDNSQGKISRFQPSLKLRYSATHKVLKNLIYRLTPSDAYKLNLVKKVEVLSVSEKNTESNLLLNLTEATFMLGKINAKIEVQKINATGEIKNCIIIVKEKDNLYDKTKNIAYQGLVVEKIYKSMTDPTPKIQFKNGTEIKQGKTEKNLEPIFRQQIRWTIIKHYQKKTKLAEINVKPLSLIFIDRVANYRDDNGIIKKIFEEEIGLYLKEELAKNSHPQSEIANLDAQNSLSQKGWQSQTDGVVSSSTPQKHLPAFGGTPLGEENFKEYITSIQGSYFAKNSKGEETDLTKSILNDKEMFDTILKDKEKLLSFECPIEFIFSHTALGVGWDNPNIFTIATLNETVSEIKKRQEIGRGLRICVNQDGKRVYDSPDTQIGFETNLLTVVPNQSYESFVALYQNELDEQYGAGNIIGNMTNAKRSETIIKRKQAVFESDDFNNLWSKISQITDYQVFIDDENVVKRCIEKLNTIGTSNYVIQISNTRIKSLEDTIESEELGSDQIQTKIQNYPLTDIIQALSDQSQLSIPNCVRIVMGIKDKKQITQNPASWISQATKQIKNILLIEMVRGVKYITTDEQPDKNIFAESYPTKGDTVSIKNGLYDAIVYDSLVEKDFAVASDIQSNNASLVIKLPKSYKIKTPVGNYEPDWAIVMSKNSMDGSQAKYYFVIETKGTNDLNDLKAITEHEKLKIECAIQHFKAIGLETMESGYLAPIKDYASFKNKAENLQPVTNNEN